MRAAIYIRVSTDDQVNGFSLEFQEDKCREYAASNGYSVFNVYRDEGISGALEHRPALDLLFHDAEEFRFDVLITYKFDRLYRIAEWQLRARRQLAEIGITWKSATEQIDTSTSSGMLYAGMLGNFAEHERNVMKERTSDGRKKKALKGRQPVVVNEPYGYRIIRKAEGNLDPAYRGRDGEYEIVEREAEIVVLIFQRYLEGLSLWKICAELESAGLSTRRGKPWKIPTLRGVLMNPIYTGTAHYGRYLTFTRTNKETGKPTHPKKERDPSEWITFPCPPLVSAEAFDRVQAKLKENQGKLSGRPNRVYPLSGMIRCGVCGYKYVGLTERNGQRYYRPQASRSPGQPPVCDNKGCRAEIVEQGILKAVAKLTKEPEIVTRAIEDRRRRETTAKANAEADRAKLLKQLEAIEKQLRRLVTMALEEPDMARVYAQVKAEKKAEQQNVMKQLMELPSPVEPGGNGHSKPQPLTREPSEDWSQKAIKAVCEDLSRQVMGLSEIPAMREFFLTGIFPGEITVTPKGDFEVPIALPLGEEKGREPGRKLFVSCHLAIQLTAIIPRDGSEPRFLLEEETAA